jgi:hypothetical protein
MTLIDSMSNAFRRCILVGDPNQLPATVISQAASSFLYAQSLFQRLQKAGAPSQTCLVFLRLRSLLTVPTHHAPPHQAIRLSCSMYSTACIR